MAEDKVSPQEVGQDLYYLMKYGQLPQSQPRRRTEVRRIIRQSQDGRVEIFEHEITEEN